MIKKGDTMGKKKRKASGKREDLRVNPALRLCPKFDESSMADWHDPKQNPPDTLVQDNCAEEHIM